MRALSLIKSRLKILACILFLTWPAVPFVYDFIVWYCDLYAHTIHTHSWTAHRRTIQTHGDQHIKQYSVSLLSSSENLKVAKANHSNGHAASCFGVVLMTVFNRTRSLKISPSIRCDSTNCGLRVLISRFRQVQLISTCCHEVLVR